MLKREGTTVEAIAPPSKKRKLQDHFKCEICSINFNSESQYKGHLKGKKHINKAKTQSAHSTKVDDPSSDTEDYDIFRKNAPRIKKKKNRTRTKPQEVLDQEKQSIDQISSNSKDQTQKSSLKKQPCPFLTNYCMLIHPCNLTKGNEKLICEECNKDLRNCKLNVSTTNSKIRFITVILKKKFQMHETKCEMFLQLFALTGDLRISISILKSKNWSISIFKVRINFKLIWR